MKILDKYIIHNFLGTLIFSLIAFTSIFVVIDLIGYLDKFIDQDVPQIIVIKYYLFYFPYIIVLSLPVAMLLASLFSIGQLAKHNEIVAMSASGLSLYRILLPLLILGIIISGITMYSAEKIVTVTNKKKLDIYTTYVDKNKRDTPQRNNDIYKQLDQNQWLNIGYFDSKIKTAHKINLQFFDDEYSRIIKRIDALKMIWEDNKWVILNGFIRKFDGTKENITVFERIEPTNFPFKPKDLSKVQKKAEEMSYWELREFIENIRRNGGDPNRWLVDLYLKIAFPFANFIIVLFGAALSSKKTRSGPAISFGISLLLCFLYFGIIKTGQALGHNGTLSPLLAAWIGNIIFGIAALFVFFKMSRN